MVYIYTLSFVVTKPDTCNFVEPSFPGSGGRWPRWKFRFWPTIFLIPIPFEGTRREESRKLSSNFFFRTITLAWTVVDVERVRNQQYLLKFHSSYHHSLLPTKPPIFSAVYTDPQYFFPQIRFLRTMGRRECVLDLPTGSLLIFASYLQARERIFIPTRLWTGLVARHSRLTHRYFLSLTTTQTTCTPTVRLRDLLRLGNNPTIFRNLKVSPPNIFNFRIHKTLC